jgi:hypothetical protein
MLAIEQLSRAEKLQMMEALWRDLSADQTALVSPAWHDAALKQAEAALESGTARLIDWSEAKDILRQRVRP